jgi:hypothetical protein
MTKQELNNFIKEAIFPLASQYGFTKWKGGTQGASFSKTTKEANFLIGYGFLTYNYYKIGSMTAYITFPNLELIVMPILEKNHLHGKGSIKTYISNSLDYQNFKNYFDGEIPIYTELDLIPVIEVYKKSIVEDFIPYFEQFSDLNKFYHVIKDENDRDVLSKMLCSIMYEFKLATIYKLCNDSRYESYINSYYNSRKIVYDYQPHDLDSQRYWQAVQDLKEVLDRTPPIYNV